MCQKNQLQYLLHIINMYLAETNVSLKCIIYAKYVNYFKHRYETTMSEYLHLICLLEHILVYIHFTLLALVTEQICTQHWIYMYHCTVTVAYIYAPHYSIYNKKSCNIYLPHHSHICSHNKYVPQMPHAQISQHALMGGSTSIYMSYMSSVALTM